MSEEEDQVQTEQEEIPQAEEVQMQTEEPSAEQTQEDAYQSQLPAYLADSKLSMADFKKHLSGPLLSLVIHIVIVVIAGTVIVTEPPKAEPEEIKVEMKEMDVVEPPPPPPPDTPQEMEELTEPSDIPLERPTINNPTAMTITTNMTADVSTNSNVQDVTMTQVNLSAPVSNSALKLTGLYAARSGGNRMVAVKKYGGSDATERAVSRALKWLAKQQNEDGTWGDTNPAFSYLTVQLTCLSLLAYLAHGDTPQSEEYGEVILRGLKKVTEWADEAYKHGGLIRGDINAHSRVAIVLAEGYAITHIPQLERAMNKAITHLVKLVHVNGGWRSYFDHNKKETVYVADLDEDIRIYNALYSAYAAGCEVPGLKDKINVAIRSIGTVHKTADGGFTRQMAFGKKGTKAVFEDTASGTLYLYLMAGESPAAKEGLTWLTHYCPGDRKNSELKMDWKNPPLVRSQPSGEWPTGQINLASKPTLAWYYLTQALFQGFEGTGNEWKRWNNSMIKTLIREQHPDGYWVCPVDKYPVYQEHIFTEEGAKKPKKEKVEASVGESFYGYGELNSKLWATVYFCMSLEVYYRYLPTFKVKDAPESGGGKAAVEEDDEDLSL